MNVPQRVSYHMTYEEAIRALVLLQDGRSQHWHKDTKKLGVLTGQDKAVEGALYWTLHISIASKGDVNCQSVEISLQTARNRLLEDNIRLVSPQEHHYLLDNVV
ncbi:hypothetical protein BDFB_003320 [Asbolus verrucosus]|uniref:Uncharacterized protein n=1 Tax=Asbolus verrucosus TaxID=1661398 RepID=A0A482VGV4_ASBVE|nr:hypothetical protein BDFB_003320 [Asbolus verrucosus]